jgi:hypothetical protein
MATAKIGRNTPCPCGSGKKYKQCCEGKAAERSNVVTKWIAVVVVGLIALGTIGFLASLSNADQSGATGTRRVWSVEHNHWHDVP